MWYVRVRGAFRVCFDIVDATSFFRAEPTDIVLSTESIQGRYTSTGLEVNVRDGELHKK